MGHRRELHQEIHAPGMQETLERNLTFLDAVSVINDDGTVRMS